MGSFIENLAARYDAKTPAVYVARKSGQYWAPTHFTTSLVSAFHSNKFVNADRTEYSSTRLYQRPDGKLMNVRVFHIDDDLFGIVVFGATKEAQEILEGEIGHLLKELNLDDKKQLFLKRSAEYAAARSAQLNNRKEENSEVWNWHKSAENYWDAHIANLHLRAEKLKEQDKLEEAIGLIEAANDGKKTGFHYSIEKAGFDDWQERLEGRYFTNIYLKLSGHGQLILNAASASNLDMRIVCQKILDLSAAWYSPQTATRCLDYLEKRAGQVQMPAADLLSSPVGTIIGSNLEDITKPDNAVSVKLPKNPLEFSQSDYLHLKVELGLVQR